MSVLSLYDKFNYYGYSFHFSSTKCGRYYYNFGFVMKLSQEKIDELYQDIPNNNFKWIVDKKLNIYYLNNIKYIENNRSIDIDAVQKYFTKHNIDILKLREHSEILFEENTIMLHTKFEKIKESLEQTNVNIDQFVAYIKDPTVIYYVDLFV